MDKTKIFFGFVTIIVTFILSAIAFGEYHSTLSVLLGFASGGLFVSYYDVLKEKFSSNDG